MAAQGDADDRTQPASPRQLERARAEGNVPLSREVATLAGLGAATMILMLLGPQLSRAFAGRMAGMLGQLDNLEPTPALHSGLLAAVLVVAPLAAAVLVASAASVLLQTGFLLKRTALAPDFGRLNPKNGLSRLFGLDGLMEAAKSVVKLVVLGFAVWNAVSGAMPSLAGAVFWDPGMLADRVCSQVLHLMVVLLGAEAVIAGTDVFWIRHRYAKSMRMSRQDVKQESQENDGNPHVKGKLRQMRMVRAKRRMLASVPTATVIVTNPTHYAIALFYDRGKPLAPRVIAKGMDEVAARIRAMAQDHHVPLVANPPLARALYGVELDAEIPAEHFKAVAEIIAYVWRLRTRASGFVPS